MNSYKENEDLTLILRKKMEIFADTSARSRRCKRKKARKQTKLYDC
jgi:hypothetical protein